MQDIRCDYYSDHYLSGEIYGEYLKITIFNSFGENAEIHLSQESIIELVKGLFGELDDVLQKEKTSF